MKIATVATVATVAAANLKSVSYYESKLAAWQAEFPDQPSTLQAFANNDDLIESNNAGNSSYTLGHNQFSGLTSTQYAKLYLDQSFVSKEAGATGNKVVTGEGVAVATDIDWVAKGAVTPVKDQGQCGSCWSFSTTGGLEGAFQVANGKLTSFSEQQLVSCDKVDAGCDGGLMDNAYDWITKNGGLCEESAYPYTSGGGEGGFCKKTCTDVAGSAPTKHNDVDMSDTAMMAALNIGPVSVAIEADQSAFQLYKSGVLTSTACGTNLDHGVLAVGYGTYTDGTDYYKVKNSWGASWGMSGYILMERGTAAGTKGMCGILSGPPSYPTL